MQVGTIEGEVDTSTFTFRATEEVRKFDFVSVKSNDKWILAQVEEVKKKPDGETSANASIIGYRDKGLTKAPRRVIEPDSIVYEADQELISDTLGLEDAGLGIGHLETNPDIDIHVDSQDFYKHFAVLAQTGAGKCVTPDTEVLMADGSLRRIEDVFADYSEGRVKQTDEEELRILSGCEVISFDEEFEQTSSTALYGYRKKADELIEIKLKSGRKVEVTPEHPLLSAENGHNFTEAEKISEGDHIAVPRRVQTSSETDLSLSADLKEEVNQENERRRKLEDARQNLSDRDFSAKSLNRAAKDLDVSKSTLENWVYQDSKPVSENGFVLQKNQKAIEAPEEMSWKLSSFLALVIAEGTERFTGSYRIIFTNKDERLLKNFNKLARSLFGLEARKMQDGVLYIDSTALKRWLEHIGYSTLNKSRDKEIPQCVLCADEGSVKEFLRVMYDCEGCMEDHEITLVSASEKIASQICYMLSEFGIIARIREKEKRATNSDHEGDTYHEVVVSGMGNMEKFSNRIGFGISRKQGKLQEYLDSHNANTNSDVVPIEGDLLKSERNKLGLSQRDLGDKINSHSTLISLYEREERRPSRKKLEKLSNQLDSSKLDKLSNSDIFWDQVKEIKRKDHEGYVYDLTVKDHHNFVAGKGGIICHNSYLTGVLIEELLEEDFPVLIMDPHGEYSSLQHPNPENEDGNERAYDIKEFSPNTDINKEALPLRFSSVNMSKKEILEVIPDSLTNSQMGVMYNALKRLKNKSEDYTLRDIMDAVSQEDSTAKWNLLNSLEQVEESNLFSEDPVDLENLVEQGRSTIINLKAVEPEATEMTAYLLAKRLFQLRKEDRVPPFLMVLEEAHNFAPEKGFGQALSSDILRKIASEGRKFGLGLGVISQRPARIDKNVLSQCNTQFILRVTNPNDLKAISKSFEGVTSEVESMITSLPPGVCFVLGNEYPVMTSVRTRKSLHGGETQTQEDYVEKKQIRMFSPRKEIDDLESEREEKYSVAYYPLYLIEKEDEKVLIDGKDGSVKAERKIPSGMEQEVLEKLGEGLGHHEIVEEIDMTLNKLTSIKTRLQEKGLIEDGEPTESVLDLDLEERRVKGDELIEFELKEHELDRLPDGKVPERVYYPYYSSGEDVYDPILEKDV